MNDAAQMRRKARCSSHRDEVVSQLELALAAALLMPQWLFVREHVRCGDDVAKLCRVFGMSAAATERRVATLFG